jgi:Skp family chaperone for outer membrane proteins
MKIQSRFVAWFAILLALVALPAAAETKIAIVRFPELMQAAQNTPQAKASTQKAEADFNKRADDLRAQEKKLADDMETYKRDSMTMTKDQSDKRGRDLNARQSDLKFQEDQFQRDYEAKRQELANSLQETVRAAVVLVAKSKGIDLVLPSALYASPELDITSDVMKQLQVSSGSAGK